MKQAVAAFPCQRRDPPARPGASAHLPSVIERFFEFLISDVRNCASTWECRNGPGVRRTGHGQKHESNSCQVELQVKASCHVLYVASQCFGVLTLLSHQDATLARKFLYVHEDMLVPGFQYNLRSTPMSWRRPTGIGAVFEKLASSLLQCSRVFLIVATCSDLLYTQSSVLRVSVRKPWQAKSLSDE